MSQVSDDREMRDEYDFSGGVRGKHYRNEREGHEVHISKEDGTVEVHYYHPLDGTVKLDRDLLAKFPTADAVNDALRAYLATVSSQ